jgi:hypothetical protein
VRLPSVPHRLPDGVLTESSERRPSFRLPDHHRGSGRRRLTAQAASACSSSRRVSSRGPHLWHSHVVVPSSSSMPNAVPTVTHRPQVGHDRLSVFGRLLVPSPLAASRRISRRMSLISSPPAGGPCRPWGVSSHHGLASRFSARIRSARPSGRRSRSGGSGRSPLGLPRTTPVTSPRVRASWRSRSN